MSQSVVLTPVDLRARALSASLVAALFGLFVLAGVGFAGAATIHNAAHDSRHSFAFPCH